MPEILHEVRHSKKDPDWSTAISVPSTVRREKEMKKVSFQKFEHAVLPRFRQKINEAESSEDIKKAFVQSTMQLLEMALREHSPLRYEDVEFRPHGSPYYVLGRRLLEDPQIVSMWESSDLPNVIKRLAEQAMKHYKHVEKHPEKTNANIRMNISV
jgi:hypothetical protein